MAEIKHTVKEIENMESYAQEWISEGETYVPGMTYEEGVSAALQWVLGNSDDSPIENPYIEDEEPDSVVRQKKPPRVPFPLGIPTVDLGEKK